MASYPTYQDFRGAVLLMIDGPGVTSEIETRSLDTMISLGESIVHYGDDQVGPLRASSMEAALAGTVAGNAVAIPDDCMELSIAWLDDGEPLEVVSERDLRTRLPWIGGGKSRKAAKAGDTLIFSPIAPDGAVLGGRYYAKPPALKDELHPTFERYPEIYLYAALYASAPFLGFTNRIPVWRAYYVDLLAQANRQERLRAYSGSRLRAVAR